MIDRPRGLAVCLLSGGLDSALAAKLILEQELAVIGVNFAGAYCPRPRTGRSRAERAVEQLGIELVTLPIDAEFIAMVKRPKHGRGKHMNPCIDCHILMIRKAWAYGRSRGAEFVITGEVLGQRPMSQNRQALAVVARESGTGDRLLRPLSAKLLLPTAPERSGLADRERLLDIAGRSRKRQMELAGRYGISDYPNPAGGCLLTEKVFSQRLAEAFEHGEDSLELVELLALGRHFRLPSGARLVVGRDEPENAELLRRKPASATVIDARNLPGPVGLVIAASRIPDDELGLAAAIVAGYSDKRREPAAEVEFDGVTVTVKPAGPEESASRL
ncbi:tRNA 4-thiouridine(8) synthase ThiI, partial [candidate division WOR-3 bacterium]|nr:tRNA 4-thiouridine(8) synthase ThiI [candidate division WOR-3 bacterium]